MRLVRKVTFRHWIIDNIGRGATHPPPPRMFPHSSLLALGGVELFASLSAVLAAGRERTPPSPPEATSSASPAHCPFNFCKTGTGSKLKTSANKKERFLNLAVNPWGAGLNGKEATDFRVGGGGLVGGTYPSGISIFSWVDHRLGLPLCACTRDVDLLRMCFSKRWNLSL